MLKPFYNKKKNIDDRLVPEVSVEDAGKALVVGEDGKITTGEGGGNKYLHYIAFTYGGNVISESLEGIELVFLSDRETEYSYNELVQEIIDGGYDVNNPFPISPSTHMSLSNGSLASDTSFVYFNVFGMYVWSGRIYLNTVGGNYSFTISDSAVTINGAALPTIYITTANIDTTHRRKYRIVPL